MKVANTVHTSRDWRIHEVARDFRLEDVWDLPTPGGPDDFPRLVQLATSFDPANSASRVVRVLFGIREKLGERLGLDRPTDGVGSRVRSVRDRLPDDLRDSTGARFAAVPFVPLYQAENEFAAELANRTVHGLVHLSWVRGEAGGYHGRMAVYVKRNGVLGTAYMAAIAPFRRLIYPRMMRSMARGWQEL